jgi:hypothetical protein
VRLVLRTGAYWMMLKLREAIPKPQALAGAEFTTLRMRLIKIGARITETASRVRIAFAAAHPEAALFASLARCLQPAGPYPRAKRPEFTRSHQPPAPTRYGLISDNSRIGKLPSTITPKPTLHPDE